MKSHARVVIVGGGVMGCSLAYHLAEAGVRDVVLLEKRELTAGSTWHAAGLCTHFAHDITIMNLRAHSIRLYSGMLEMKTGQPVSFHQVGALRITRYPHRLDEFRQVCGLGKYAGHDFHILGPSELKSLYPLVRTEGIIGAIHEPGDGYVDPSQATHAFARGARNKGVEIYRNTPVEAIEEVSGEWLVHTPHGSVRSEHVVNAAGTWCREIGSMMGVDVPVVPMLHQYVVLNKVEDYAQLGYELPMIRDPDESWYLRQEQNGIIIGPYERNGKTWAIDRVPVDFGMDLLPPDLDRIENIVMNCMERIPAASQGGIRNIVHGPITFTPDANPLVGPAFGKTNAWLLTGSSMGVMEGGGCGDFLARWIVDGHPPADALSIDPRRFGGYVDRDYRVSKAVESFAAQFAVHYPYEERSAGRPKRKTPVYESLKKEGAVFGAVYGWERPNWFAHSNEHFRVVPGFQRAEWFQAVSRECLQAQQGAVLGDQSAMSKFEVSGSSADRFMGSLGTNRPPAKDGQIALNHALHSSGGTISEWSVTRIARNQYYLAGAARAERHDHDLLRRRAALFPDVHIENLTTRKGVLGLMGPNASNILSCLTDDGLSQEEFPWLSARRIRVADIEVLALRISYIGESGWELHHDINQQEKLFMALREAGMKFDMGFYGAFAMNAMRMEKGYRAWGMDLTSERTPVEAGLGRFVKPENRNFVGRDALLERTTCPDRLSMHLLELEDTGVDPYFMHAVYEQDHIVGIVTSGAYGHRTGMVLALAYLQEASGEQPLYVDILGNRVAARILKDSPYDPSDLRMKK